MASAVLVGTPPNSVRPLSVISTERSPRRSACSWSATSSSSVCTCSVTLRNEPLIHAKAMGSSGSVAMPVVRSAASAMAEASHAEDAWAPCAISLPRRICRSRRITMTCFTTAGSTVFPNPAVFIDSEHTISLGQHCSVRSRSARSRSARSRSAWSRSARCRSAKSAVHLWAGLFSWQLVRRSQ